MSRIPSIRWAAVGIALVLSILCSASDLSAESKEDRELAEIGKMIEEKGLHWTAGKTSVSGLSDEERRLRLGYNPEPDIMLDGIPQIVTLGDTIFDPYFDWRMFGCVTPPKDQRDCGVCWAFAAVAAYESHMLIYDGRYSDISEQAILSCMDFKHYSCCSGGYVLDAYRVMMEQGTVSEACMPYDGSFEPLCRTDDCMIIEGSISEYGYITRYTDQEVDLNTRINLIKEAVLKGPVSASMLVYYDFYYYEKGCYEPASSIYIGGHAVLVVGWDDRMCDGEGAWICKNSWGTDWGMNGFFYIKFSACDFGYRSYQLVYRPSDVLLTVQSPDGGESFVEGSEIDVAWITSREREQPDCYNVYLSMDGGGVYGIPIAEGLSNNDPITFRLPTTEGEGSILVTGMLDGEVGGMDWSDQAFTVARDEEQPFVQVLSPSGGEVVGEGGVLGIEWLATDNAGVSSIDIFYSTNRVNTIAIAYGEENDSSYDWAVPALDFDSLYIRVVARDVNGLYSIATSDGPFYLTETSTDAEDEGRARYVNRLEQNYPNPFNGTTTIRYTVAGRCEVAVGIYDTAGRLVRMLERCPRAPGSYEVVWRGTDGEGREVASGVYYCRIGAGAFSETRKIVYLR